MIAGIAALRLRVRVCLAFKISACDIVEQHFVLDGEKLSATLRQMRFEGSLVREQMIEPAVEPILVDLLIAELEQIAKRGAAIPVPGNVQFARRLAASQAPPPSSPRRCVPGPSEAGACTTPRALPHATRRAPDTHRQTGASARCECPSTEPARQRLAAVIEQRRFFRNADQPARPRAPRSVHAHRARQDARLLDHPPSDPNAAHQRPIAMNFPVLPANRVAQIHAPSEPTRRRFEKTQGRHYTLKSVSRAL